MKSQYILSLTLSAFMITSTAHAVEVGGMLKSQSSYNYLSHQWQKQDWQLDLEFNRSLGEGELTLISRATLDLETQANHSGTPSTYAQFSKPRVNNEHGSASIRELYWEFQQEANNNPIFWKLGKQQVVWGEADGLKLLDVVNPQSYREFILDDFDDARIPLWMINAEIPLNEDAQIQLLWIPDTTTHNLASANSAFSFTSPLLVPQAVKGVALNFESIKAPAKPVKDSDFGIRLSQYWSGWDMTLNYLYHYVDEPILTTRLSAPNTVTITSHYARSHLIGGSASNAFGSWTFRSEVAYETNRYHRVLATNKNSLPGVVQANQWSSVIGLDYQGLTDQFLSFQWFQTRILAPGNRVIKSKTEDTLSFLWEVKLLNETLTLSLLNLYSLDHHDGLIRPKVRYNLQSNLDLTLGVDRFYGDQEGLFGQFDHTDRLNIGFEWGIN